MNSPKEMALIFIWPWNLWRILLNWQAYGWLARFVAVGWVAAAIVAVMLTVSLIVDAGGATTTFAHCPGGYYGVGDSCYSDLS